MPPNYKFIHVNRLNKPREGSVEILNKSSLRLKVLLSTKNAVFQLFEYMVCSVGAAEVSLRLCLVYHPPASNSINLKASAFLEEWKKIHESY